MDDAPSAVVPAQAGTQVVRDPKDLIFGASRGLTHWIPAFAGMTVKAACDCFTSAVQPLVTAAQNAARQIPAPHSVASGLH